MDFDKLDLIKANIELAVEYKNYIENIIKNYTPSFFDKKNYVLSIEGHLDSRPYIQLSLTDKIKVILNFSFKSKKFKLNLICIYNSKIIEDFNNKYQDINIYDTFYDFFLSFKNEDILYYINELNNIKNSDDIMLIIKNMINKRRILYLNKDFK